ncbi:MAG: discoidin domain-containing protein [Planctomycetota bacterium]
MPREAVLSWKAGEFAPPTNGHKVYFSTSFNDVNDGIGGIAQDASSYTPPQRLDFGTTYYWRVDEVNSPPDFTVFEGDVWSFTTEPIGYAIDVNNITATASSAHQADMGPEKTIDGSGLDANDLHSMEPTDMWLSGNEPNGAWIEYEFDKVYKVYEMWVWNSNQAIESILGFGLKDVAIEYSTNGTDYTTLGTTHEFAQAPGAGSYAHNTTIDLGATAKYVRLTSNSNWGGIMPQYGLSEVRFLYIPVQAREPNPDSGATDVDPDVVLSWRAGREAAQHDVYLSSDEQAVIDGNAPVTSVTEASHGPLDLDLGVIYYWKINEVNMAETPTTLDGDVWNFTTREFLVVDDFESYNDLEPTDPESNRIFLAWIDGYEVATNGSLVGYDQPTFVEQGIVHSGEQAMPFFFSNTAGAAYSEAELTLSQPQDWTKAGIATLVLYFHGTPGNTGQLYVKVNGSKVVYDGDAADIATLRWTQWNIDLASVGTNLQNVTTLSIGIDGTGASGTLYVDDIRLYRLAPEIVVPSEEIWIEAEAADTITAPMEIYDDPLASSGKYISTDESVGNSNDNPPPDGIATYNFTVQGGIYKIEFRVIITDGSNSFWVRVPSATNYDPGTDPLNPGWIRFNDIDDGAAWHWDEVHSDDHDQQVVKITLPAGQNTLEIVRREDGAMLDAILISKID